MDRRQSVVRDALKRLFFRFCDGFFCYGERSKEYLVGLGASGDRIVPGCQAGALPHGYAAEEALCRRVKQVGPRAPATYLFVGVLDKRKGCDTLIHAFYRVRQHDPTASLTLVGEGPMREELESLVHSLGLAGAVHFHGAADIDRLKDFYASAGVFVLPSASEPWGLVVNEALAYGCPAVVSDMCGCGPDLIVDGQTGVVFRAGDAEDLAEKMRFAVSRFADVEETATRCIGFMQNFTALAAASRILAGCKAILESKQ